MLAPRRTATVALLLASLAGCGGGGESDKTEEMSVSSGGNELAASDASEVLQARRTIDAACGSDGSGSVDRSAVQLTDAVSTVASLARQYPDRVYETGNVDRALSMDTIANQVTSQLRRCGVGAEADRLEREVG